MNERNVMLFNVSMDSDSIVNNDMQLSMEVNCHEFMTLKEFEEFKEHIGEAAGIVRDAIITRLNSECVENSLEDEYEGDE